MVVWTLGVELCLVVRARRLRRLRQLFEQTPARPGDDPAASRRASRHSRKPTINPKAGEERVATALLTTRRLHLSFHGLLRRAIYKETRNPGHCSGLQRHREPARY